MATPLHQLFGTPPFWRVFDELRQELGEGEFGIDFPNMMEAIGPAFLDHAQAMFPRRVSKPIGGKRSDATIAHYILPHGRHQGGPYAYRIVSVDTNGKLDILDTIRLPDDSDLFGRHSFAHNGLSKLNAKRADPDSDPRDRLEKFGGAFADVAASISTTDGRFDAIFDRHRTLDRLIRRIRSSASWISDMRFIEYGEGPSFTGSPSGREAVVADMLIRAEKQIGTKFADTPKRDFVKKILLSCLENFDHEMGRAAYELLKEVRENLDREAIEIMAVNPSGVTTRNYNLLTRDKDPAVPPLWRAAARACPIILLMRDRRLSKDELLAMAQGGFKPERVVTHYFGVTDPARIAYYMSLNESNVGLHNAERLKQLAASLERLDGEIDDPKTAHDWDNLATLVDAAGSIAAIVDRPMSRVLRDLLRDGERTPEATIYRHFSMRDRGQFESVASLREWKNRIVTSVITPKIVVESRRRGLSIPLQHIFFMVSGHDIVARDTVNKMPKRLRRDIAAFNEKQSFSGAVFEGVSASDLLDVAFEFATHRHSWDEKIRDRVLSNRLFENGNQFPFPFLPEIQGIDEYYQVSPIRSMADLLKECADLEDFSLIRFGHKVAKEPIHFLSIRSPGARTCAIACIEEPASPFEPWTIRDCVAATDARRNRLFEDLVMQYVTHTEFTKHADPARLAGNRRTLQDTLVSRAQDRELMGFKVGNISERREVLEALKPYIRIAGGWSIDTEGCISAPKINAVTDALIKAVGPFYRTPAVA